MAGLGQKSSVLAVHVALPKWPISQLKLDQKSRQQALRAYCSNIYCEQRHKTTKRNSKHTNFNLQLHSLIYRLDRQSCRSINQNLFIHCLCIYSTDNLRSYVWEIDFSKVASKIQKFGNYRYTYQNSIYTGSSLNAIFGAWKNSH